MDPEVQSGREEPSSEAIFEFLEKDAREVGSTITRVPVIDVIKTVAEGPVTPVVLLNKSGHLYVLWGAIRINDELLCQVLHGGEAVSLFTKQMLLEGDFQEAWRLEKKTGLDIPIHVGSAAVSIDKLWHNFGEVFPETLPECTFRLKNTSDKVVVLDKPIVSCQCTVPDLGNRMELAPDETFDLKVVTKATGTTSLNNSIELGLFEQGSGVSRHVQLALIGNQRESMEINPKLLDFGMMFPGKPCLRLVTLREKPTDRFVLKEIDSGSLPITHKIDVVKDQNGLATYRVQLELSVDKTWSGGHKEEITLITDSYVRPRLTIPVRFQIEPLVKTIPSIISLGTVVSGESRETRVQFVSQSNEPLDVQIDNQPIECSITFDRHTPSLEMIVAVKLKEPGIWQGVITGRAITPSQQYPIEIRCVGYGQEEP